MRRTPALAAPRAAGVSGAGAAELRSAWQGLADHARCFFRSPDWIVRLAAQLVGRRRPLARIGWSPQRMR